MTFTKEELVKSLRESVCEVVFTKVDGSERTMKCTLREDALAPFVKTIEDRNKQLLAEGKEVKVKAENPNVLSVIDMEKNAWRSFKLDTIKSVKVVD